MESFTINLEKNNMIPISKQKVNKSGDTMTGPLVIENKNAFTGVDKTRTVNGTDYTARFGVGADGSASLELHANSATLGRIDVRTDGTIKNWKSGKILQEKDDTGWVDLTLGKNVTLSTVPSIAQTPQYRKIGNHVFIRGDVSATYDGTNTINVATLPFKPQKSVYKLTPLNGNNIARIFVNGANGVLYIEWIKRIADGSNETTERTWIQIDIDFWID